MKHVPDRIDRHPAPIAIRAEMQRLAKRCSEVAREAADLYAARESGGVPEPVISDRSRAIATHIEGLLNGSTPQHLKLPTVGREDALLAERDAIVIVQKILARRYEDALDKSAEQWVASHTDEWKELAAEFVKTAVRLWAIEDKARQIVDELCGHVAHGMALHQHLGFGSSLLGNDEDPLRDLKADAIKQGVVAEKDIRKVTDEYR